MTKIKCDGQDLYCIVLITLYVNKADGATVDAVRFPHEKNSCITHSFHTVYLFKGFIPKFTSYICHLVTLILALITEFSNGKPFPPSQISTVFQLLFLPKVVQVLQIHCKENKMFSIHIPCYFRIFG